MLAKKFKLPVETFPRQATIILDDGNMALRGIKNNLTHNRVGIVFKKGAFKAATLRNRIKRIVFDFFGENWENLGVQGLDLLVTLKPAIIGLNIKQTKDYLKNHVNLQRTVTPSARKRPGSDL